MEEMEEILKRIRAARKATKTSQQVVADYLGINVASYRLLESGKTKIKVEQLIQIAACMGIDVKDLFIDSPKVQSTEIAIKEPEQFINYLNDKISENNDKLIERMEALLKSYQNK